jgi:hypothetical protein
MYLLAALHAKGWIGDRSYLVVINTAASVIIARPDIIAGLPKRDLPTLCALQMASGHTLLILKEALVKLTLD